MTPKETYEAHKKRISELMADLNAEWEAIQAGYEEQLKTKPDSWAGIGRGGDLQAMESALENLIVNRGE